MPAEPSFDTDIAIIGGGLSGSLVALAVRHHHPDARIRVIEPSDRLGGTHIWSFFDTDVAPVDRPWLEPLVTKHWDGYDVRFPNRRRTLTTGYNSITSDQLDRVVRERLGQEAIIAAEAVALSVNRVTLADQRVITARAVVDARGAGDFAHFNGGWQKFVGRMLHLRTPHGLQLPMIMDATVDQFDGYRFVYLLPFDDHRIFVEDTYYSDGSNLDVPLLASRVADYAEQRGWQVIGESYAEQGVLPVVSGGDVAAYRASAGDEAGVARVGVRGALFHALTSFTMPDAVRTASAIAAAWPVDGPAISKIADELAATNWRNGRLYRLLNRMLFKAADPERRYYVLEHFHRLPQGVIERFYAGETSVTDAVRILSGRPPVAIGRALKAMLDIP